MFSKDSSRELNDADAMAQLLERMVHADRSGLDIFGIGEHHRKGFLDSAPALILAAAAARTERSLHDSLERLGVDYVDLIQCHDTTSEDFAKSSFSSLVFVAAFCFASLTPNFVK